MITPLHPNKRDAQQVEVLSGMGATPEFIATHLSLPLADLQTHYGKQLQQGIEEANLQVAKVFHEMATSGEHPTLTLSWMKMRAGWSDNTNPLTSAEEEDNSLDEAKEKLLKLLNRAHASN